MTKEKWLIWGDIAEKHLRKLAEYYKGSFSGDAFARAAQEIAELPTVDAVEVVRCKDCWKSGEGLCSYNFKNIPGKDFCGDGERKDND